MNDGQRTAATSKPFRVGFPLYPNCTLVDFAGATQVFAFTSRRFKPIWLAPTMDSIVTSEGVSVVPNYTFDEAKNHRPLDMLFIPGGGTETRHNSDPYLPGVPGTMCNATYIEWVRKTGKDIRERGGWVGSVCTGAFILAVADLLNGFQATKGCMTPDGEPTASPCGATTYWSALPLLTMFPKIDLAPGYPRWLLDTKTKRFTGGGVSSSLDLALALVKEIAGTKVAEAAQLAIQYHPGPPVSLGDPGQANTPEKKTLLRTTCENQKPFIKKIEEAVKAVLGEGKYNPAPPDLCVFKTPPAGCLPQITSLFSRTKR